MRRRAVLAAVCSLVLAAPLAARDFDHYTNPVLTKAPAAKGVQEITQLTPDLITDNDRVLPRVTGAMLVVRTNDGRNAKLLVQSARKKIDAERSVPILYIERFVTYREGEERTIVTQGEKLSLFPGFRLSLEFGQIVPEELGGDLRFVVDGDRVYTEPVGKAKLYLLTAPLPEAKPAKGEKVVVGVTFLPRYFAGKYKLHDDGRRSGILELKVDDEGNVTGAYYSDRDGSRYEVAGRVGTPAHSIRFTVKLPRAEQTFQGLMFTGDGKAIVGTSQILRHETGFYALRVEE